MKKADALTLSLVWQSPETDYLLNIQIVSNWRD
jgi:hypothetical protein